MYVKVYGPKKLVNQLPSQEAVEEEAFFKYGERAQCEGFTDEVHIYVWRRNSKRRDFVASYQYE